MTPWLVIILIALVAGLVISRLRNRARRRRAASERRAREERIEAEARDLDDKVTHSQDGGPQYRNEA